MLQKSLVATAAVLTALALGACTWQERRDETVTTHMQGTGASSQSTTVTETQQIGSSKIERTTTLPR